MRTEKPKTTPTRDCGTVLLRAARAFAAMNAAVAKVEEDIAGFEPFWMAQHANQAYNHYVQGQAHATTARDLGAPEYLLRYAAAGDEEAVQEALLG